MLWTGPAVISSTITVDHVKAVFDVVRRLLVILDNLHANDYDNGRRLFLGPYACVNMCFWMHLPLSCECLCVICRGRDASLLSCGYVEGILSNPNCEYEANFVPLRTL
jgi:protein O-GlcNAcase / histone acetyltransferase